MKTHVRLFTLLVFAGFTAGAVSAQGLTAKNDRPHDKGAVPAMTPVLNQFRGGGTPSNDACTGAVDHALAVGETLALSGDNTGATDESGIGFVLVYEQFTLTTCADITVNYCVPGSEFTNFIINLTTSCPDILAGLIDASSNDACTVSFPGMAAGSYYIPVMVDPDATPVGAYTIEVTASACDAYCVASATDATFEVINNVAFAGINNPSATTNGYENFTDIAANVATGNSYPITVENANGYETDQVMAWIDYDQSQTFEPGELVYTSEAGVGPYTGSIAIPANALLGQTRMRLRLQDTAYANNFTPCGTHQYGQVQDYTVNISMGGGSTPPNDACTGAVDHPLAVGETLSLSGDNTGATDESGIGFVLVYEQFTLTTCADITVNYCVPGSEFTNFIINLTTSCPDILAGLIDASSNDACTVSFPGMAAGSYYIPVMVDPDATPVGAYTIEVTASACDVYCAASATDATFEVINNVDFAGIDNPSATSNGYEDFTAIAADVETGGSYPITVENAAGYDTDMLMAWIDFDQSQTFEPGELVYTSEAGVGPYSGTIDIPSDAALGQTRMRLRLQDTAYVNNFTACGTHQYGQVQDYAVNVTMSIGIPEAAAGHIGVYPNPGTGDFTVMMPEVDGDATLEVLDVTGRLVHATVEQAIAGKQVQLNLAGILAKGSYLLRLTTTDARYTQWVVIK
ncbi:MAG: T9SS type A sorting domain-containing protein [Flavobacteriales bacterium]|jgi:hypothetical protein|nr:T9SS type A sorting domain-containing protein [Flavobacteriales bacterium]